MLDPLTAINRRIPPQEVFRNDFSRSTLFIIHANGTYLDIPNTKKVHRPKYSIYGTR